MCRSSFAALSSAARLPLAFAFALSLGLGSLSEGALAAPPATSSQTATVKKGDTLFSLSRQHGLSVARLRELNGLKNDNIKVGQVLRLRGNAPAAVPAPAAAQWYTVKSGDTLGKIAAAERTTVTRLRALNGLKDDNIKVGQKLRLSGTVPAASRLTAASPARVAVRPAVSVRSYTVKSGDTLGKIAGQYGVSVGALQAANHLRGDLIAVGQRLTIPPKGSRAALPSLPPALPPGMEARLVYSYERVKPGDTPSRFASRFSITPTQVRQLNGLSTINQIVPGAKLLVPRRLAVPVPPRPRAQATRYRRVTVQGVNVDVVQVDLRHRDVLVAPVLPRRGLTFGSGATVRSLTALSGARALVNGSFFHPHTYAPAGDIVMQGRLLTWGRIPAALAITPDNRASIRGTGRSLFTRPGDDAWSGMETVIAAGPRIVSGGVVSTSFSRIFQDPAVFGVASRSAIGLSSSRDLMLVSTHAKVSVNQMGRIMAALGARDALLLDGGSSTGISWNGSVLLDSVRKVSYGIGVFTNYQGRRYSR